MQIRRLRGKTPTLKNISERKRPSRPAVLARGSRPLAYTTLLTSTPFPLISLTAKRNGRGIQQHKTHVTTTRNLDTHAARVFGSSTAPFDTFGYRPRGGSQPPRIGVTARTSDGAAAAAATTSSDRVKKPTDDRKCRDGRPS